jgi:hypothetical protein
MDWARILAYVTVDGGPGAAGADRISGRGKSDLEGPVEGAAEAVRHPAPVAKQSASLDNFVREHHRDSYSPTTLPRKTCPWHLLIEKQSSKVAFDHFAAVWEIGAVQRSRRWDSGTSTIAGLLALVLLRRGLLRLPVDALLHAGTADLPMPISSAISRTVMPGRQQGGDPQPASVLHVLHGPGRRAVAGLEPRVERLDVLAVVAARLLDVHLEARALGHGVSLGRRRLGDRDAQHRFNPRVRGAQRVVSADFGFESCASPSDFRVFSILLDAKPRLPIAAVENVKHRLPIFGSSVGGLLGRATVKQTTHAGTIVQRQCCRA